MFGSLASNRLCGVEYVDGLRKLVGTYTAAGIDALCEGIKNSAVSALKCAAPETWLADQRQQHCLALFGSLKDNNLGTKGGAALAEGLKRNVTLTSLECVCPAPAK